MHFFMKVCTDGQTFAFCLQKTGGGGGYESVGLFAKDLRYVVIHLF